MFLSHHAIGSTIGLTSMFLPQQLDCVSEMFHALLVTPLEDDLHALHELCPQMNWQLDLARSVAEARSRMVRLGPPPIIICERDLPDGNWRILFQEAETLPHPPRFVVCSRLADEYLWAEVLNLGGFDVLAKPFEAREVNHVIQCACDSWHRQWGRKPVRAFCSAAPANAVARAAS